MNDNEDDMIEYIQLETGYNMLMVASENGNKNLVGKLLSLKYFNVNLKVNEKTAIDLAWEKNHQDIVLMLLKENSLYPSKFDIDTASNDIQNFSKIARKIHEAIKAGDINTVKEIINNHPTQRYFLNTNNNSAIHIAVLCKNLQMYKLLFATDKKWAPHESRENIFKYMHEDFLEEIRLVHLEFIQDFEDKHLNVLLENSYLGRDNISDDVKLECVKYAYKILSKIPLINCLLKIVAAYRNIKVIYDFYRESVEEIDPTSNKNDLGTFHLTGEIYISAKLLLPNSTRRFENIATIAHEFCHFVMKWVFRNRCIPFVVGNTKASKIFRNCLKQCRENLGKEKYIDVVFKYDKNQQYAELIVRIPHLLALYYDDNEKLEYCRQEFPLLFQFFERIVLPQLENALKVIPNIIHDVPTIKWIDLTEEQKLFILASNVNFQGTSVLLEDIIEDDLIDENSLTSQQIKDLFNGIEIIIGEEIKITAKFYIERNFMNVNDEPKINYNFRQKVYEENLEYLKTIEDLFEQVKKDGIIILGDTPGAGKTVTFQQIYLKLKEKFPTNWISLIDLKAHVEACKNVTNELNWKENDIIEFLSEKILKLNHFEAEIFKQQFKMGKVIFLYDAIDEISPIFYSFIATLIVKIKKYKNLPQWISTRPEYVDQLTKKFDIFAFKLVSYTQDERKTFFYKYFKNHDGLDLDEIIDKIEDFIKNLETSRGLRFFSFNNPLMLQLIGELFSSNSMPDLTNVFSIYKEFVKRKIKIINEKGNVADEDRNNVLLESKLTIMQAHQIYALKLIFGDGFINVSPPLDDKRYISTLELMGKEGFFTNEEISRFGILNVEKLDFVHRTFAEFFIAQYIVDNVWDTFDKMVDEEANLRIGLTFHVLNGGDYKMIKAFIQGFIDDQPKLRNFNPIIQKIITTDYLNIFYHCDYSRYLKPLEDISNFLVKSPDILNKLWSVDDKEPLFFGIMKIDFLKNEEYIGFKKVAQKFFSPTDVEKIFKGERQIGSFLYHLWKYIEDDAKIETLLQISTLGVSKEMITDLKSIFFFYDFFKYLKKFLPDEDLKETLLQNYFEILNDDDMVNEKVWEEFDYFFTDSEIKNMILGLPYDNYMLLEGIHGSASEETINNLFKRIDHYFDESEIVQLLIPKKTTLNSSFLSETIINHQSPNVLEIILNFYFKHIKEENIKRLIISNSEGKRRLFFDAIRNKNIKIFQHLWEDFIEKLFTTDEIKVLLLEDIYPSDTKSTIILEESIDLQDLKGFIFITNVYRKYFSEEELGKHIIHRMQDERTLLWTNAASPETYKEILNFLTSLFKDQLEHVKEIIMHKSYSGWSICHRLNRELLEVLGPFVEANFTQNEIFDTTHFRRERDIEPIAEQEVDYSFVLNHASTIYDSASKQSIHNKLNIIK